MTTRGFTSDNASGVHPAVLAAVTAAGEGHAASYGADTVTAALAERAREVFGPDARIFPVFNGTGANIVAAQALLQRWDALVTTDRAHLVTDESTAPQLVGGIQTRTVPAVDAKITPDQLAAALEDDGSVHHARPAAVSLTQSTELGTTYTPDELAALAAVAHGRGARVHVDGARLANAAARLGTSLRALTTDAGVDVVSFGATKNGAMFGDAVVVLDPALAEPVDRLRKASTQLASKMRFVSAQLLALLTDDLWRDNAARANAAADLLADRLTALGAPPRYPVQANAVFVAVPPAALPRVVAQAPVLAWDAGTVRAVASFDTTPEDVEALVAQLAPFLG
ncbi:aminotransferase class I/II-fold pyridoxal phosphate-dependent enzyme [Georgenia sp. TF02-10]|uniref:threonine aldolase family protein n=1 Tax=Georgenia sp. TF02-10 TaxID=2917725 RepID=UPI001FA78F23|nr:aminotransferase class I/II-fold pyridoxal phosphate-dependent enzyme [Georgenia sp. TF02-10]UNX54142.1 aminotransferase class I/II-fold pyridoxal phosphate-dependent enzyme [Georgenia sp. TF02-10]